MSGLFKSIRKLVHRFTAAGNSPGDPAAPEPPAANASYFADLGWHGVAQFRRDNAPQMASALAYRTLFSLVPVLVIGLVVAKAFYGEQGIRDVLERGMQFAGFDQITIERGGQHRHSEEPGGHDRETPANSLFNTQLRRESPEPAGPRAEQAPAPAESSVPAPESVETSAPRSPDSSSSGTSAQGPQSFPPQSSASAAERQVAISQLIEHMVDRAVGRMTTLNYSAITIISIGVFIYAALSLLIQIEQSFNSICQAPRGRGVLWRILIYWTTLTLGAIGIASSIALGRTWENTLAHLPAWATPLGQVISTLAGVGVTWLLLLFVYTRMPNARVRLKYAAIGALVSAIGWQVGKMAFVWFIKNAAAAQHAIYGSLALLPITLMWLYITWYIILAGLEITWLLQTTAESRADGGSARRQAITIADPTAGVALMQHLAAAFAKGEAPGVSQLSRAAALPSSLTRLLLEKLVSTGLVHRVDKEHGRTAYALARPPQSIGADEVVSAALQLTPPARGASLSAPGVQNLRERWIDSLRGVPIASGTTGFPLVDAGERGSVPPTRRPGQVGAPG